MIKNYFLVAWRNLLRNRGFSFINIFGLAIGMAAAILILLWIKFETSVDREYALADRIYVMYNRDTFSGEKWAWSTTPTVMGPAIKKDYAEVEETVRVSNDRLLLTVGDKQLYSRGLIVDSVFFKVFDFEAISGDLITSLNNPNHIVVTEELALQLFSTTDVLGRTVKVDSSDLFKISAVLKDMPNNSRFKTSYFLPWEIIKKRDWDNGNWTNNSISNYILLRENADINAFNEKVRDITIRNTPGSPTTTEVFAYPITQAYLYGKSEDGKLVAGKLVTVRMFGAIVTFIVIIACINFMNLTTARSEKRAKEVGVRKVAGASRGVLIVQFLGECILLSLIAGLLALVLVFVSLPAFNSLIDNHLQMDLSHPFFWINFLGFVLFTGILAGSYPAFLLSSFPPVTALKGTFRVSPSGFTIRKVLVVLQFTFAIILIISTLIIQKQIKFAQNRELGYDQEKLIYVPLTGSMPRQFTYIKQAILKSGAGVGVTKSLSPITEQWSDGWGYSWPGSEPDDEKLDFIRFSADADFTKVMGVNLIQGRDIDIYTYPTDSNSVLLNEAAVKKMRIKDPIGLVISDEDTKYTVVGVIKDFIIGSPYEPIRPMMVMGPGSWFNMMHIKLNPDRALSDNLQQIENILKEFNPNYPFEYRFVDEQYAKKFENTRRTATLSSLFTALAILISCLGLFGLSAYMATNRVKEIGVRKVLGASVKDIVILLTKDFLKLVGISFLIASPIAWYFMREWLKEYTYKIDMSVDVYVLTGLLCFIIAVATVSLQAIRAATSNPVKSLRTE